MRRFQIRYQNSNRVIFDPLLAEKQSKIGKIPDLANFRQFFAIKEVRCYLILILMPDLESSHHLPSIITPFVIIFKFWIFCHQCYYCTQNAGGTPQFFLENVNFYDLIVISVKNCIK